MNKSYKSIWNEALGTYVAAAETASTSGRKSSSSRKARRAPVRAHAGQLVLEQRIVFDAAVAATVVEVQDGHDATQDALFEDIDQLAEQEAEVAAQAPVSATTSDATSEVSGEASAEEPAASSEVSARTLTASSDRATGVSGYVGNVLDNDAAGTSGQPLEVVSFTVAGDAQTYQAGDVATIEGVGSLVIRADGSYEFTPVEGYQGSVPTASYTVSDGTGFASANLVFNSGSDSPDLLDEEVMAWAEKLATGPAYAFGWTKRLIDQSFNTDIDRQLEAEMEGITSCAASADMQEGIRAFVGKREAVFKGE